MPSEIRIFVGSAFLGPNYEIYLVPTHHMAIFAIFNNFGYFRPYLVHLYNNKCFVRAILDDR